MLFLFALLVIGAYVLYTMNKAERIKLLRTGIGAALKAKDAASQQLLETDPFRDALRERTPRPLVAIALIAVNVAIFMFMLMSPGQLSSPDTLISWGGSFAPLTTHGEWWRLAMTTFLHRGFLVLLVNMAALASLGYVLERLTGHLAFGVVYVAAGLMGSLVSLATYPMAIDVGPSAAIFGLYGMLAAATIWGVMEKSPLKLPLRSLKILGPPAVLFVLTSLGSDALHGESEFLGLVVGFGSGIFLTKSIGDMKPAGLRAAVPMAATAITSLIFAVTMSGVADARPEIKRVIEVEGRTASAYQPAVDKFTKGRMTADELAGLINRSIRPELQTTRARLNALKGVPQEQQAMVTRADEYLRLRDESWRLRAQALHKSSSQGLREADKTERASLEAFEKLQPPSER
jgi:membrane associated rhomboid family serine protease